MYDRYQVFVTRLSTGVMRAALPFRSAALSLLWAGIFANAVFAQQPAPNPCAPGAMRVPDTSHLPPGAAPFAGEINPNAAQSKSRWPPITSPPKGAPNIL